MKRTKIICTIGPATDSPTKIKGLIEAGMNVARLNFSHGTYEHHAHLIAMIRKAGVALKAPVAILQDLQGPRIRLGKLPPDGVAVKRGDTVALVPEDKVKSFSAGRGVIVLPMQVALQTIVKPGEVVLIKDGLVRIVAHEVTRQAVVGKVEQGDVLTSNRGINLPQSSLPDVVLTKKDREDVRFGLHQKVDWMALSFVRNAADIKALRQLLPNTGDYRPKIVAKIERQEAVHNFNEVLAVADGVMIARGDLGIELPAQQIPLLQKQLISKCLRLAKPVIVATQMLESMITNARPTRAEVSDVANAVIDHADALMLSGETATGKYPLPAGRVMRDIIVKTEASSYSAFAPEPLSHPETPQLVAHTIKEITDFDRIKAIVVMSSSGASAQLVAAERPNAPIMALTQNQITSRQMNLIWGVTPYLMRRYKNLDDLIVATVKLVKKEIKVEPGDKILIASGHPTGPHGHLNLLKIHTV